MPTLEDVGFGDVADPVVRKTLEEALAAAEAAKGGRRTRGGGPKEEAERRAAAAARRAIAAGEGPAPSAPPAAAAAAAAPAPADVTAAAKEVSRQAVAEPGRLKRAVDTVLGKIVPSAIATAGIGAVTINRPDVMANLAEIVAATLSNVTDIAITSTWGDWGQAVLGIGRAIGVIGKTGALQAFQGPVVPFAIATAIMTWRAQGSGKGLFEQIKDDAKNVGSSMRSAAEAAVAALPGRPDPIRDMMELAQRARDSVVRGEGGIQLKDWVQSEMKGTPAVRPGAADVGLVRGFRAPEPRSALERLARTPVGVDPGARSRRASVMISEEARRAAMDVDGAAAPAREAEPLPAPRPGQKRGREEDEGEPGPKKSRSLGGRRKTQKKRKSVKRRTTRRLVFSY